MYDGRCMMEMGEGRWLIAISFSIKRREGNGKK
jgi:hypothetical protein